DEPQRPGDAGGGMDDGGGRLEGDGGDAGLGAERIARNGDGVAGSDGAGGEMGPEALVELVPEAAMDEDHEALRRPFGQEEIEQVARLRAVAQIELGAAGRDHGGPEARRRL